MKTRAALLALVLAAAAHGQDSPGMRVEPFVLEPGPIALPDLIDRCAAYLGRNILCNPQELASTPNAPSLRLQQRIETYSDGCEELLAHLLSTQGLVLTVLDEQLGMYEVLALFGQRGRDVSARAQRRTPEQILTRPRLKMPVITTVPLQFINGTVATNALRPFFASQANNPGAISFGNVGANNSMLIVGIQDQVAQAIELIRTCDVEAPPSQDPQGPTLANQLQALEHRIGVIEKKLASLAGPK